MKAEEIAPTYMANDTAQFRRMAANPYAAMAELINAFQITQLARVLATFSFAEHLANGPKTAAEIAKAASIDPDAAFRILRFAASYGLVTSEDGVRFSGSPTLATLLKDTPGSLRGLAMTMGGLSVWLPWGRLPDAVRTGKPQTVAALGTDTWSYPSAHPDDLADVVAAISGASAAVSRRPLVSSTQKGHGWPSTSVAWMDRWCEHSWRSTPNSVASFSICRRSCPMHARRSSVPACKIAFRPSAVTSSNRSRRPTYTCCGTSFTTGTTGPASASFAMFATGSKRAGVSWSSMPWSATSVDHQRCPAWTST